MCIRDRYEIGHNFRNEGISTRHNPEFTSMELYQAYGDYEDIMRLVEEMYSIVAQEVLDTQVVTFEGQEINLTPPWRRVTMRDIILEHSGVDIELYPDRASLWAAIQERSLTIKEQPTWGKLVEAVSYTHLDVYKRQAVGIRPVWLPLWCSLSSVSYTHLDVYKRQPLSS